MRTGWRSWRLRQGVALPGLVQTDHQQVLGPRTADSGRRRFFLFILTLSLVYNIM